MNLHLDPAIGLGAPELVIIFAVIVLLFGAAKLPELARGTGRALRIFKAETKGLTEDDKGDDQPKIRATQVDDADDLSRRDDTA